MEQKMQSTTVILVYRCYLVCDTRRSSEVDGRRRDLAFGVTGAVPQ
jgi:hypothetical protein